MSEGLALRYTVAVVGFAEGEHRALSAFLQAAADRAPAYVEAPSPDAADFLVASADPATATRVRQGERLADTVFVGAVAPAGAVACIPRPVTAPYLVRELDQLLEQRLAALDAPTSPDWMGSSPGGLDGSGSGAPLQDVLVVDDSRVALRFLQVRLQQRGFRVHVASTAEQALERLAAQPFALVFLDVALGPASALDGLALCQRIKQGRAHMGAMPRVLLVTGQSSSSDRVRGELAGCDAYLTKPLMDDDLSHALHLLHA